MKNRYLNIVNLLIFIIFIIIAFSTLAYANSMLKQAGLKYQVIFLSQKVTTQLQANWFQQINFTKWREHSFFFLLLIPLVALPNGFHLYGWAGGTKLVSLPLGTNFKTTLLTAQISLEVLLPIVFVWIGCCLVWDWWVIKYYRHLFIKGGQGLYRALIKDYNVDPATYLKIDN